jgi:hypothetical protein
VVAAEAEALHVEPVALVLEGVVLRLELEEVVLWLELEVEEGAQH